MSGTYLYCPGCGEYLGSLGSDECHLCGWRNQESAAAPATGALVKSAQAVVDRWDSPKWKDAGPTADFIHQLRRALAAFDASTQAEPSAPKEASDADPLQGAADWLVQALGSCGALEIGWRLSIGHNRANRLYDAARKSQADEGKRS